ncbi:alpha/beta hydrolase [Candidatus Nesciobacter abundans]|uniref:Alpha/beta fold hydrolase n=1 Tax=Candidatus Nesciobacter abundans TaxID=2601668 RepID=A0A5C0UHS3_9PROT|nr:alpha/beta fold hydrolase [Candidatus Nesciobacter abundans]QEK39270.1 alpha/beta fold hydrolase [Candidatus Nesciobacter abundans]
MNFIKNRLSFKGFDPFSLNGNLYSVVINTEEGLLEGRYFESLKENRQPKSVALVLHPDPKKNGSMNNKVVKSMFNAFAALGFDVLRFNFRGVGKSKGKISKDEDQNLKDALKCMDWLISKHEEICNAWIAGFAFGGFIGMKAVMRRPDITGFVLASPTAETSSLNMLTPCPDGIVVAGGKDTFSEENHAYELSKALLNQSNSEIELEYLPESDHYFSNHEDLLRQKIESFVKKRIRTPSEIITVKRKRKKQSKSAE